MGKGQGGGRGGGGGGYHQIEDSEEGGASLPTALTRRTDGANGVDMLCLAPAECCRRAGCGRARRRQGLEQLGSGRCCGGGVQWV